MPLLARMLTTPLQVDVSRVATPRVTSLQADCRMSRDGRVAVAVGAGMGDEARVLARDVPEDLIVMVSRGSVEEAVVLARRLNTVPLEAVVGVAGGRTLGVTTSAATRLGLPMGGGRHEPVHDGSPRP